MKSCLPIIFASLLLILTFTACGGGDSADQPSDPAQSDANGLSAFELEHGIGPITETVTIDDEIDEEMARRGFMEFDMKCSACHQMESRFVGPPLGDVIEERSPEFIMNFILNPEENTRRHPVGQELLQQYMVQMTFQNVSETEAREIFEYFRYVNETGEEVL